MRREALRALIATTALLGCGGEAGTTTDAGTTADATTGADTDTSTAGTDTAGTTGTDSTDTAGGSDSDTDVTDTDSPDSDTDVEPLGCNGHVELCDRAFDQVAFATTHNSHATKADGYPQLIANQTSGLADQLEDGVRGLLMDIYLFEGTTHACHGPCTLASQPHAELLATLRDFMDAHPREVVTIIYEDYVEPALFVDDFAAAGLDGLVYAHEPGTPWPTLGAMIEADTRLVVTAESGGPPPPWFHHVWDVAWDTPYEYMDAAEFSCEPNRGDPGNDLFLLNHWVSNEFKLPSEDDAAIVNQFDVLHGRAALCQEVAGQLPNFIAVDFYERGDLVAVVDALNGV